MENLKIIIKKNGIKYSNRKNRNRIFSPDEWNKFIRCIKDTKKPIFYFLINTGTRIQEALGVKKEDIDFSNNVITLKNIKRRTFFSDGKIRKIKISSQYNNKLKNYCENFKQNEYIFLDNSKLPGNYDSLQNKERKKYWISKFVSCSKMLKRKLKESGIKDYYNFSLHNIRKTTESWLVYLGVNTFLICKHFGHNYETATKHYVQPDLYNSPYKFKARIILGDLYL